MKRTQNNIKTSSGKSLIEMKGAMLEIFLDKNYNAKEKKMKSDLSNSDEYWKGYYDGDQVSLNAQIDKK